MKSRTRRRLVLAVFVGIVVIYLAAAVTYVLDRTAREGVTFGGSGILSELWICVVTFAFPMVGYLILSRQPTNTIGWLFMAIGLVWGLGALSDAYVRYALLIRPGSLPGGVEVLAATNFSWVPGIGLIGTYLILLFPDGHLPSRRWRPVAWVAGGSMIATSFAITFSPGSFASEGYPQVQNPLGLTALHSVVALLAIALALIPLSIVACAVALILRYRRSKDQERLQLKWLAFAAGVVAFLYLLAMLFSSPTWFSDSPGPSWIMVPQAIALFSIGLIPVACGFAILKHRLFDIEVVINKTLVYGSLAAFITGVYVAVVVGIGQLVGSHGQPNVGLSIAATALVAFAFQPVRERVQRVANRLVYGRRATPYEVLSRFSDRLGAVHATDDLLPRMARVLAEGIGASRADVWLRVDGTLFHEGTWPADSASFGPIPAPTDELPAVEGASRTAPVRHQGELLGALSVTKSASEPLSPVEADLLDDLAAQAGLVLRNVRLMEELRASRQRIVAAQDEERRRLERDIHDGAQQQLITLSMATAGVRARLDGTAVRAAGMLDDSISELRAAVQEIRELAQGIHPSILTTQGLAAALETLADRCPVPVVVRADLEGRLPPQVEATAYFAASEALANVAKYAGATHAEVTAERRDGRLIVSVADDGVGGADAAMGSGLRGLVDRVAAVGGELSVSSPAGGGTTIRVSLPCGSS
jgi:signal transduction histidine kinase